jgi:hypothetical protein
MAVAPGRNYPLNCGTAATGPTLSFAKKTIPEESFNLALRTQRRITTPAVAPAPTGISDRVVVRSSSASYVEDVVATASRRGGYFGTINFSSLAPTVADGQSTNEGLYQFSHVTNGTARVSAESERGLANLGQLQIGSGATTNSDTWQEWTTGSLGRHIVDQVVTRAATKTSVVQPFQILDHLTTTYTRNPNHFLYDVDLGCVSVWNSVSTQQRGGTLITPEHCLVADHFNLPVGATVRFVDVAASTPEKLLHEDRTVVGTVSIPFNVPGGDIQVVRLSGAVTADFCTVAPPSLLQYLPSVTTTKTNNGLATSRPRLPIVATNQDKHFGYKPCFTVQTNWQTTQGIAGTTGYGDFEANQAEPIAYPDLVPFVRSGCSGHPVFLLINGSLVLLGLYFTANSGSSFQRQATHDVVNAALTTLGGGYQLTETNLSGFTAY